MRKNQGQFGKNAPAIGIALYVDTLLLGLSRQGLISAEEKACTLVVYEKQAECEAIQCVCDLRGRDVYALLEEKKEEADWADYEKRIGTNGIVQVMKVTAEGVQPVK